MGKRRGRPKRENVIRFSSGQIKEEILVAPLNMEGVEMRTTDRDGNPLKDEDGKIIEARYEREPLLRKLARKDIIEPIHERAGDMFYRLWERMRRTALAAMPPYAKTNKWERGFGHEPELTEEEVELGASLQRAYDAAYQALMRCGKEKKSGIKPLIAVEAACLGHVRPKIQGIAVDHLLDGLEALSVHFQLERGNTRAA